MPGIANTIDSRLLTLKCLWTYKCNYCKPLTIQCEGDRERRGRARQWEKVLIRLLEGIIWIQILRVLLILTFNDFLMSFSFSWTIILMVSCFAKQSRLIYGLKLSNSRRKLHSHLSISVECLLLFWIPANCNKLHFRHDLCNFLAEPTNN